MEKFRTVTYEVHNPKIKKSVRFAVLADPVSYTHLTLPTIYSV